MIDNPKDIPTELVADADTPPFFFSNGIVHSSLVGPTASELDDFVVSHLRG